MGLGSLVAVAVVPEVVEVESVLVVLVDSLVRSEFIVVVSAVVELLSWMVCCWVVDEVVSPSIRASARGPNRRTPAPRVMSRETEKTANLK